MDVVVVVEVVTASSTPYSLRLVSVVHHTPHRQKALPPPHRSHRLHTALSLLYWFERTVHSSVSLLEVDTQRCEQVEVEAGSWMVELYNASEFPYLQPLYYYFDKKN